MAVALGAVGTWSLPATRYPGTPAEVIEAGAVLVLKDSTEAEVTDIHPGFYWFAAGRGLGMAIDWRAGSVSGVMFRRISDLISWVTEHGFEQPTARVLALIFAQPFANSSAND